MTHLFSSLSAVDRKRVWASGGLVRDSDGWLACYFLPFFATLMAVAVAPLSQGVHFIGCCRCQHKRLVTAIYESRSPAMPPSRRMRTNVLDRFMQLVFSFQERTDRDSPTTKKTLSCRIQEPESITIQEKSTKLLLQ